MTTTSDATEARPTEGRASGPADDRSVAGETPLLTLRGVTKRFGPVEALSNVDLDIPAGKVTALVGDNGAGKSTLIKAISGISVADEGELRWDGHKVEIKGPRDATELGIATVYQDLALCDNLDIVQNMYLGHELRKGIVLNEPAMEAGAKAALAELSVVTVRSIRQHVGSLSGGQRQAVAVARAVMGKARLVIMDEPTAALGVTQTAVVVDLIKKLADSGIAVLVISHNLIDVFAVADRIAVLYLGRLVHEAPAAGLDAQRVVELITTGALGGQPAGAPEGAN